MSKPDPISFGTGSVAEEQPPAGVLASGWRRRVRVTFKHLNWFWKRVSSWIDWISPYLYDEGVLEAWRVRPGIEDGETDPKLILGGTVADPRDGGAGDTQIEILGGGSLADRKIVLRTAGGVETITGRDVSAACRMWTITPTDHAIVIGKELRSDTGFGYIEAGGSLDQYWDHGTTNHPGAFSVPTGPAVGRIVQIDGPALAGWTNGVPSGSYLASRLSVSTAGTYRFRCPVPLPAKVSAGYVLTLRGIRIQRADCNGSSTMEIQGAIGHLKYASGSFPDYQHAGGVEPAPHAAIAVTSAAGEYKCPIADDEGGAILVPNAYSGDHEFCVEIEIVVANPADLIEFTTIVVDFWKSSLE